MAVTVNIDLVDFDTVSPSKCLLDSMTSHPKDSIPSV